MEKNDYKNLEEITVKSQNELDAVPLDFNGRIYIEFGTFYNRAIIKNHYHYPVKAWGNSHVVAWGNSHVEAWGNSHVEAWGNSCVEAWGNSHVVAMENSSVKARENSSVKAWGNVQVVDYLQGVKIEIAGNARIVCKPKTIHGYMDFYGIRHNKKKAVFFKAVHKKDGQYYSNHTLDFKYVVGEHAAEKCDTDIDLDCSNGIHISHLAWAIQFGESWNDLAILEVETDISDIVLPKNSGGKVRTSKIKVLREIPLEECGVYGKILARRKKTEEIK